MTYIPYYAQIIQSLLTLIYVTIILIFPKMDKEDSQFYKDWSIIFLQLTCVSYDASILALALTWNLVTELIKFQSKVGLAQITVRIDEHFKRERKIVRRFVIFFGMFAFQKIVTSL